MHRYIIIKMLLFSARASSVDESHLRRHLFKCIDVEP